MHISLRWMKLGVWLINKQKECDVNNILNNQAILLARQGDMTLLFRGLRPLKCVSIPRC